MTREDLWEIYCEKNKSFRNRKPDDRIQLTTNGLRKMFDQTWDIAFDEGKKLNVASKPKYDLPPGFEQLFDGFK